MSLYNVLLLSAALLGLLFSFIVFSCGKDRIPKNSLAVYNLAFSCWCLCQFMGEISTSAERVLFWTRMSISFAVLIPYLFVFFVYSFLGLLGERKGPLWSFGGVSIFFLGLLPSSLFVESLSSTSYFRYYPKGGVIYALFSLFFLIQVSAGLFELFRALHPSSAARRKQISYVILAAFLGFGGGVLWFLPVFGMDIYPFGIFITPFYLFAGAYAVAKHRLLDIKVVIGKWAIYTVLISIFTGMYITMAAVFFSYFKLEKHLFTAFPAVIVLLAFSILFDPLRSLFQRTMDRLLFGIKYDYQSAVKRLSASVSSSVNISELAYVATQELTSLMGVRDSAFFMVDNKHDKFAAIKTSGRMSAGSIPVNIARSFLVDGSSALFEEDANDPALSAFFEESGASVFVPIIFGGEINGFVLFGRRSKDRGWIDKDRDIFEMFSSNASITAQNILLSEKLMGDQFSLYNSEKISAIGMIAGEMAHEIKNPLTAIRGLVQVFSDNMSDQKFVEDFLAIVPRQIERINNVVNRLLKLENNIQEISSGKPVAENISLSELVSDVLKLCYPQYENRGIRLIKEIDHPLIIKADKDGLEQVIFNLVLNAVQSMPDGGLLVVRIFDNRLEISDTGCGIKKEDLERIFDPFYTTKESGAGLGLSVTRKILADNGATISVSSVPGKGSVFSVIFEEAKEFGG